MCFRRLSGERATARERNRPRRAPLLITSLVWRAVASAMRKSEDPKKRNFNCMPPGARAKVSLQGANVNEIVSGIFPPLEPKCQRLEFRNVTSLKKFDLGSLKCEESFVPFAPFNLRWIINVPWIINSSMYLWWIIKSTGIKHILLYNKGYPV